MLPTLLDWMDVSIGSDDVAVKQAYFSLSHDDN